jgi:adenylate kinase
MWIVFIGPPGAGKGTQSRNLAEHLRVPHLSTGDMLRMAREDQTSVGRLAERYMANGQLVPDPIILTMVGHRLGDRDCASGILFDGFPRTLGQAEALDLALGERGTPLHCALELRVNDKEVIERLAGRKRNDDHPEIIAQRLNSYWKQTQPLLDYYKERGVLEIIDGHGPPEEVFERIKLAVERRRHPQPHRPASH